jgi:hypothetical protein
VAPAKVFPRLHKAERFAHFGRRFDPAILQRIDLRMATPTCDRQGRAMSREAFL